MQLGSLGDEETKHHMLWMYIHHFLDTDAQCLLRPRLPFPRRQYRRPPQWEQTEKTSDFRRVFGLNVWGRCVGTFSEQVTLLGY